MRVIRLAVLSVCVTLLVILSTNASVLFVANYKNNLDADYSLTDKSKPVVKDVTITADGQGPLAPALTSAAANAGYGRKSAPDCGLYYDSSNIDVRQGTIQMWVKTDWAWDSTQAERDKHLDKSRYFLRAPLADGGSINLKFSCGPGHGYLPHLFLYISDRTHGLDYGIEGRVGHDSPNASFDWHENKWHFITATWTARQLALYADGKKLGEIEYPKPLDLALPSGPIVVGNGPMDDGGGTTSAGALIGGLRILDFPLDESAATKVPDTYLSTQISGASVAASGPAMLFRPEARRYFAYRVAQAPVIDGDLSDKAWTGLPVATGFVELGIDATTVKPQSEVRAAYDDKNLYLGIFLWEDTVAKLKSNAKVNQGMDVFNDDAAEILIAPNKTGTPFIHMGINSGNASCVAEYSTDMRRSLWSGKLITGTRVGSDGWSIEVAIPFEELKIKPSAGEVWRWNVGRDRRVSGLSYSSLGFAPSGAFATPSDFGELIFGTEAKTDAREEEATLNARYLASSRVELEDLVSNIGKELALLQSAGPQVNAKEDLTGMRDQLAKFRASAGELLSKKSPSISEWNRSYDETASVKLTLEAFSQKVMALTTDTPRAVVLPYIQKSKPGIYQKDKRFFMVSPNVVAVIDSTSGAIAGLWERETGRRLMTSSFDIYYAESRTREWKTDGRLNKVLSAKMDTNGLTLKISNPDLPGAVLQKNYHFTETAGQQRILCSRLDISGSVKELTLLRFASNTSFDQDFLKGAFYDRLHTIGTTGDPRQQLPVSEISEPLIERAWFNSTEGRAQFAAFNPTNKLGIAEYLYKVDNRWHFPQGMAQSWWRSNGWEMGGPGQFLGEALPGHSFEMYYHVFRGDRLVYHREYLNLPEYKAIMADWQPSPKATKIKLGMSPGMYTVNSPTELAACKKVYSELVRPDEITVDTPGYLARVWGDYPASDGATMIQLDVFSGQEILRTPAQDYRATFMKMHDAFPQAYFGHYNWLHDLVRSGDAYKAHPDWALKDKWGKEIPGIFYAADRAAMTNWNPAYMDHMLHGLLNQADYYSSGTVYLDFGVCSWYADWDRKEVINLNYFADWLKKLHIELAKRGKLLWLNAFTGQAYYDISYHEVSGAYMSYTKDLSWRVGANVDLMRKFYARQGTASIPIYWSAGDSAKAQGTYNEERYRNLVLATGLKVTAAHMDPYEKTFPDGHGGVDMLAEYEYQYPVHEASMELIPSQFVEIGLNPAWWRDLTTDYEGYTLKQGNSYLLNVISHYADARTGTFTIDPKAMMLEPGKRVYIWEHVAKEQADFVKKVPQPDGWDKMFKECRFSSVIPQAGKDISLTLPGLSKETVRMVSLTQVPAFVYSAAGQNAELLLSDNLGCSIVGTLHEAQKQLNLRVKAEQPVEVLAVWPFADKEARVQLEGGATVVKPVQEMNGGKFVLFKLDKGAWQVKITSN